MRHDGGSCGADVPHANAVGCVTCHCADHYGLHGKTFKVFVNVSEVPCGVAVCGSDRELWGRLVVVGVDIQRGGKGGGEYQS